MNIDFSDSTMRNEFELWLGKNKPQVSVHTGIDIAQYWIEKVKLLKSALKDEIESKKKIVLFEEINKRNQFDFVNFEYTNGDEKDRDNMNFDYNQALRDLLSSDLLK